LGNNLFVPAEGITLIGGEKRRASEGRPYRKGKAKTKGVSGRKKPHPPGGRAHEDAEIRGTFMLAERRNALLGERSMRKKNKTF